MSDTRDILSRLTPATVGGLVGKELADARSNPMNRGHALAPVAFPSSGNVTVDHKLGRKPVGYKVTWSEGAPPSFHVASSDERQITFVSSAAGTHTLFVW